MFASKGVTVKASGDQDTITLRIRAIPAEDFDQSIYEHDARRLYDFLIENLPVGTLDILINKLNKRTVE